MLGKATSYKEIKAYINSEKTGNGCKLLMTEDEFKEAKREQKKGNTTIKLKILCKCGDVFNTTFNKFKNRNKNKCNSCSNHTIRTYKNIKNFIEENSNCRLLTEKKDYKNNRSTLLLRCNCGETFYTNFENFRIKKNKMCKICSKKLASEKTRKTQDQFEKEVYNLVGDEYTVLGKYINSNAKIRMRHNCDNCNDYEWEVKPSGFLVGNRCPKCAKNARKTTEIFAREVEDETGGEYSLISDYKNSSTNVKIRHNCEKCNYFEYEVLPLNFYHGDRCPKCSQKMKKTTDIFKDEVYSLTHGEYDVVGEYLGARKNVLVRHNVCGNEYEVSPTNFLRGKRCPYCNESRTERLIEDLLKNKNIVYEREYIFDDLLSDLGYPLRFDFAIFDDKEKTILNRLIEYDGEFHYKKYYEDQNFEKQKIHDKLKDNYCKDNNIKLIRIPYWKKDNIKNILSKELYDYNKYKSEITD